VVPPRILQFPLPTNVGHARLFGSRLGQLRLDVRAFHKLERQNLPKLRFGYALDSANPYKDSLRRAPSSIGNRGPPRTKEIACTYLRLLFPPLSLLFHPQPIATFALSTPRHSIECRSSRMPVRLAKTTTHH
jgi:hypothetical protein